MSRTPSHARALGAAVVAVLAAALLLRRAPDRAATPAAERTRCRRTGTPSLPDRPARRRPARPDDAGGEGRPDDPGRARRRRRRPVADHRPTASAACCPAAARCRRDNTPEAWADMVDRYQAGGAGHPARHPAALRRRLGARPRQPAGRDRLPAQHRARRHPRPEAGRADRAHHGRGDPGHRPAVGLRAVRLRGPRRPLGPHLRELRRGPRAGESMETVIDGLQGRPRTARRRRTGCSRPPSTTPATGSRRTAPASRRLLPDRPGHRPGLARGVRRSSRCRRTARRSTSTTSARSCRRSRASTGPRTVSATR